ncbi:uncharacterized protein LOC135378798 isoform X2 [Ornithodoros turicata]|uniref:uncharacterized protein LOC135378798 isoform X2 n=1 Tax=Ornithodoros turicata TaxID=34597 RepID=UPI003138B91A
MTPYVALEFQHQVMRILNIIRLTQQQHTDVLEVICGQRTTCLDEACASTSLIQAPFNTSEALENFNDSLSDRIQGQLINEFAQFEGTDIEQATRNILTYLLTDSVAMEFIWLGQKGKKKFSLLKFPSLIFHSPWG